MSNILAESLAAHDGLNGRAFIRRWLRDLPTMRKVRRLLLSNVPMVSVRLLRQHLLNALVRDAWQLRLYVLLQSSLELGGLQTWATQILRVLTGGHFAHIGAIVCQPLVVAGAHVLHLLLSERLVIVESAHGGHVASA